MEHKAYHITFINRTLKILDQYQTLVMSNVPNTEQYEVTLLINCLLGLLIFPHELCYTKIPNLSVTNLQDWGILPEYVQDSTQQVDTLRQLVRRLRSSTAHGNAYPAGNGSEITDLVFEDDQNGFKARIPVNQLKLFVTKLGGSVQD